MAKASEALIDPLRKALEISEQEHSEARVEKEQAIEREKEARVELGKVQRALKGFDPDYEPPEPEKKGKRKKGNGTLAPDKLRAAFEAMKKLGQKDGYFTQRGVRAAVKQSPSQTSIAFTILREWDVIRKGGKVEGSSAEKWAIMDEAAFERHMKEQEANNG